jgi:transcriptional regulator with XRE-family HTH domain
LSTLRKEREETVERFAEHLAVKPTTVRDWLNAKVLPRADALTELSRRLGVSIDWLLGVEGATRHPTQWRSMDRFEDDLALAIVETIRRRGGPAADLLGEFELDGRVALERAADDVEAAVLASAERLADWIAQRDAWASLEQQAGNVGRIAAALRSAFRLSSPDPREERVLAYKRQLALETLANVAEHAPSVLSAVSQARGVLAGVVTGNPSLRSLREGVHGPLVALTGARALAGAIDRETMTVDSELLEQHLGTTRRLADRLRTAKRTAATRLSK